MIAVTLLFAAVSGVAVVIVSHYAEKLGGKVGGLLAAAPVTTTLGVIYVASNFDTTSQVNFLLRGNRSVLFAVLAMPALFFPLKWTTKRTPQWLRFVYAFGAFLFVFSAGVLLTQPIAFDYTWEWAVVATAVVVALDLTFSKQEIPQKYLRAPPRPSTKRDHFTRFLFGAAVILLVEAVKQIDPLMGRAWAVFPGSFLATLILLFWRRGAAFSARAAQGGVLGAGAIVAFLCVMAGFVFLVREPWAIYVSLIPAWGVYIAIVAPRIMHRKPAPMESNS